MHHLRARDCFAVLIGALLVGCAAPEADPQAELVFVHEVLPVLQEKCFACHGDDPDDIEGDFDIRTRAGMLEGGESGEPSLVPGDAEASPIYQAVTWTVEDFEMPPKENDRLSDRQVEAFRAWIDGGAPWPDEDRRQALRESDEWDYAGGITVATSGALSESWAHRRYNPEDLWAFLPVADPSIPWAYVEDSLTANPVDAFINRKLQQAGVAPAAGADRRTLIRRVTFGLHGLPPTPEETQAFVADPRPDAYERLIERLLASPRYGEQWARHWLDVTRYADTDGGSNDFERPNAWRYRDYVIRAFNEDKPYDQFVREQVAGDELDADDPEMLVAAGFLRMGPWEHTAMSVAAETRQQFLDDVTNGVGETFLAIPLRCASCHDHKFDPIPTRDYYRVQAVFAPVQLAERGADYLPVENTGGFRPGERRLRRLIAEAEAEQRALNEQAEAAVRRWFADQGRAYVPPRERRDLTEDEKPPRNLGLSNQDLGVRKALNKRLQILRRQLDRYEPLAFSVYNGPPRTVQSGRPMRVPGGLDGRAQPTMILAGGSVYAPSDTVSPGVLSAVASLADPTRETGVGEVPATLDGRRTAFAEWLADPGNPLTTRAIVNRVWGYHFGKALAANPNNFGVNGEKPTHPQLLDWMTTWFVENGWSIKDLHRLILTSDAYQRAASHPDPGALHSADPDNDLLAVFEPRRLHAEELRDAMLFISGELDLTMGGLPARPEINLEVALQPRHTMGSIAPAYQPDPTPAQRNRRTIYAARVRGLPDPMLEVFNRPGPDLSCERRTESTVTPQAFSLLNSRRTRARALAFAHRLEAEAPTLAARISRAIERAWNRPPTPDEVAQSRAYVEAMVEYHREHPPEPTAYPTEVRRTMFEEMTGEAFSYTERLDVYEDYTPDLKPWDVEPETRALADLATVLFNANEFVYVY